MGLVTTSAVRSSAAGAEGAKATVETTVDKTKLGLLTALLVLFAVFALILYLNDKDTGAAAMLGIVTAILSAGFGVTVGEKVGASDAVDALRDGGKL